MSIVEQLWSRLNPSVKMVRFLQTNFLIVIILNSGNFFSYAFQLIVARSLPAADYGSFNALVSFRTMVLSSLLIGVIPFIITRYTVRLSAFEPVKMLIWKFSQGLFLIGIVLLPLGLLILPWLKSYLHITSTIPILITIITAVFSLFAPILSATLQGLHRVIALSWVGTGSTIIRVILALILVTWLGWGINGALLTCLITVVMTLGAYLWLLYDVLRQPLAPLPPGIFREMARYAVPVALFTIFNSYVNNIDLVLVQHYLPEESGFYATATILGKIAVPSVLVIVLFPEAAKNQEDGEENTRFLWLTLWGTALLGGSVALLFNLFPEMIITLLFGQQYVEAAPLLQIISIAMALLALSNVIFTYNLAHFRYGFRWFLAGGVGLLYSLIHFFHDTPLIIAQILLLSTGLIFMGSLGSML
ncbi:MAG: polysaccharide biosynthesis protein [Candidatus Parabeggiatoa sp. nov. 3]|nr:MAG: polysaccharide biosynthesis protein [Gammaproteobacteria bacterium]RKZ62448.1 MAG: polysaccharide biosynthesis protein [Gammaproteobacteria bacterium]RKZ86892.1 MAG: polysaccharide biosynthesis protein [Gammaproteobacteria bacterium]